MPAIDETALQLLHKSVKRFNDWKSYQLAAIELSGADLSGLNMAGAELSQSNLKGANLTGADLSGANLQGAVLYQAQAPGATLARCKLDDAYAAEANFDGADLSQIKSNGANFARSSFVGARLDHARLWEVRFDEADLKDASFVGALIVRTPLPARGVDLRDAVIEKSHRNPPMSAVDFSFISDDAMMFAVSKWTPRPDLEDHQVPTFVQNLRRFNRGDADTLKAMAKLCAGIARKHHRISACDMVACVPSSNPESVETPVKALAAEVARITGLRDGSSLLIRHKAVLPSGFLSISGDEGKHLDSVKVAHSDMVGGRTILLLDDFIDTGCTFRACRHQLLAVGATQVFCLALALRLPSI